MVSFPYHETEIGNHTWRYIEAGVGESTLLILTGALGVVEFDWRTISHFADRFRIIALDYPEISTMGELVEGIVQLLSTRGIDRAHILGGSYGGMVAQVFFRRYPHKTDRLILSHTLPPALSRARRFQRILGWFLHLPERIIKIVVVKRLSALIPSGTAEADAARSHLKKIVQGSLSKSMILASLERTIDFHLTYDCSPLVMLGRPSKILLVMSDDDPSTPKSSLEKLKANFPVARVHLFHNTGHASSVLRRQEYLNVLERFLLPEEESSAITRPKRYSAYSAR